MKKLQLVIILWVLGAVLIPFTASADEPKLTLKFDSSNSSEPSDLCFIHFYVDGKEVGTEAGEKVDNVPNGGMTGNDFGYVVFESTGSIPDGTYTVKISPQYYEEVWEIEIKDGKRVEVKHYEGDKHQEPPLLSTAVYKDGQLSSIRANPTIDYYQGTHAVRDVELSTSGSEYPYFQLEFSKDGKSAKVTANYDSLEDADSDLDTEVKALYAFKPVVQKYRSLKKKPKLPPEARAFAVQAQDAMGQKRFDDAGSLYQQALEIAPWWPQGHYNEAEILGESGQNEDATKEMKKYLMLEPKAKDAQKATDEISKWEGRMGK